MAFDVNKPADNQTIAAGPGDVRENFRALKEDKLVNAQKLMDYAPGNASGNIPVSNGTVSANLNADLLDGQHGSYYSPTTHTHAAATSAANGLMSNTDKQRLDGIDSGAEVNQYAFSFVSVGSTTIQADSKTDTLTLAAGTGVTLTPDATNDKVTIAVTQDGHSHAAATASAAGFMAAADKSKLDGIKAGAEVNQNAFSKVVAGGASIVADEKSDTLTIKAGSGITITGDETNDALTVALADNGHIHPDASNSASGFMSIADKNKLNGIIAGAEPNQNAFGNILVGATKITADGKTDTLELAAGTNISLTPDPTNDKVTIAVTGSVENANALGNLDVGQFVRASGQAVTGDLNNYRRPGMYKVNKWTNISNYPSGAYEWGTLVVFRGSYDDSHCLGQLYLSHGYSQMWYRGGVDSGGWEPWKQIATVDGNVATATRILDGGCVTAHNGAATTFLPDGITVIEAYNNGYPGTYGNVVRVGGSGDGELFLGWKGDTTVGDIFYRSKRDTSDTAWSDWTRIWHAGNFTPGNYLPLSGGTVSDKLAVTRTIGTNGSYSNSQLELRAGDSTGQVALGFTRPGQTAACLRHQGNGLELVDANGSFTQFKAGELYSNGHPVAILQYAIAGDVVLYAAPAESSSSRTITKIFRIKWPGYYRVKFQLKGKISVSVCSSGVNSSPITSTVDYYNGYSVDVFVASPNERIIITGSVLQDQYSNFTAYIKEAQVCYSGAYTDTIELKYGAITD